MVPRSTKPSLTGLQSALSPDEQALLNSAHERWAAHPGSAVNGTGPTGLQSNDSTGWFRQQNENMQALDLERKAAGQAPMPHRFGGEIDSSSGLPSTMFAPGQTSAVTGGSGDSTSPVLTALRKAVGKK